MKLENILNQNTDLTVTSSNNTIINITFKESNNSYTIDADGTVTKV